MRRVIIDALCASALAALFGCVGEQGLPVRFVIPDDYHGPLTVIVKPGGDDVPIDHGEYVYHFPQKGTMIVSEPAGFKQWHEERAVFESGRPIPIHRTGEPSTTPGEISFYELGYSMTRYRFFVGTHSQMLAYVTPPDFPTNNPALPRFGSPSTN